jgi:hypothetical protein
MYACASTHDPCLAFLECDFILECVLVLECVLLLGCVVTRVVERGREGEGVVFTRVLPLMIPVSPSFTKALTLSGTHQLSDIYTHIYIRRMQKRRFRAHTHTLALSLALSLSLSLSCARALSQNAKAQIQSILSMLQEEIETDQSPLQQPRRCLVLLYTVLCKSKQTTRCNRPSVLYCMYFFLCTVLYVLFFSGVYCNRLQGIVT